MSGFFFATIRTMSQTTEPKTITAGDTIAWSKTLTLYPADAFALNYTLQPLAGGSPITVSATPDGTTHAITISAATSADFLPGEYRWYSYVTDLATSTERHSIAAGTITVAPNPLAFTTTTDLRTHARKTLDAIEAVLEGRASESQAEYSVSFGGSSRSAKSIPIAELLQLRSHYAVEVRREEQAEAIAAGLGGGNRILTRFV